MTNRTYRFTVTLQVTGHTGYRTYRFTVTLVYNENIGTEDFNEWANIVESYEEAIRIVKKYEDLIKANKKIITFFAYQQGKVFRKFLRKIKKSCWTI